VESPERKERCARPSGDVAAQAVMLLNESSRGAFRTVHGAPASVSDCLSCHGGGKAENNVSAKMDCGPCHHGVHEKK
jgi:hypothetical protein